MRSIDASLLLKIDLPETMPARRDAANDGTTIVHEDVDGAHFLLHLARHLSTSEEARWKRLDVLPIVQIHHVRVDSAVARDETNHSVQTDSVPESQWPRRRASNR